MNTRPPRWWTPKRRWELAELLERGLPDEEIAQHLSCSVDAVIYARKKYGIKPASRQHLTARAIGRLMGCSNGHPVARWIENGWLKAHKVRRTHHGTWQIQKDDFLAFLENPAYWHRWQPERITELALREWALELRAGTVYLSLGEVAERCYVVPVTAWTWVNDGILPGLWDGWRWRVRESDLEGFVAPGYRDRSAA